MTFKIDLPSEVVAVREIPGVATVLDAVCRTTGVSFSAIAHVTATRWVACAVDDRAEFGLAPGDLLPVEQTLCRDVRSAQTAVVIADVQPETGGYQHKILSEYGIRSYISVPILLPDGQFFGTLCGFSRNLCDVGSEKTRDIFRLFAELIGFNLQSLGQLRRSEVALEQEQENGTQREKFIAVLIHELRNPLTAIESGLRLLERRPERLAELVPQIRRVLSRMDGLIRTTLDFTEIRFGDGLVLERETCPDPGEVLTQIIDEVRTAAPGAVIRAEFDCSTPVSCDPGRLAQLVTNLLRNAVSYGTPGTPVILRAASGPSGFELSVINEGEPVSSDIIRRMFSPFSRGQSADKNQGLGLGLFIASEVAQAHGGSLVVETEGRLIKFIFRMPAAPVTALSAKAP